MRKTGDDAEDPRTGDGRALRYQHRRTELLDAVLAHLVDHGLEGMSYRTLGEAVGVSHVTLRHHFGSKEQLLAEIFTEIRRREPIPVATPDVDATQLIRDLWREWSEPDGANRFKLLFEVYGHALRQPQQHRAFLDEIVTDWLRLIAGFSAQFGVAEDEADVFATVVLAQMRGLQLDLLATGDHVRVTAALEMFLGHLGRRPNKKPEP